jgi:magnesium chelatase subunit I
MTESQELQISEPPAKEMNSTIRSLRELIEVASGRAVRPSLEQEASGRAEVLPFPFLALVGQTEMKLALLLALINPNVGGVLLIGPRGTGKTTAIRSLVDLLPDVPRSLCYYGCMPEDIEIGGIDAVCPDCARKYALNEPLAAFDRVRLVELPLNAQLDDVVGGIDERAAIHERVRLRRGVLAQADKNLLHVDEVNLLADEVVDAILDASAQGVYTVRRGPMVATYRSQFTLIGSMNPEEGHLRPQIFDRFGLRIVVRGLTNVDERLEAYKRTVAYLSVPRRLIRAYEEDTRMVQQEIQSARDSVAKVTISEEVSNLGLEMIRALQIDSLRAEITLFEAAKAYAAMDARQEVCAEDLRAVTPMAVRMRRSVFMNHYFTDRIIEEEEIELTMNKIINNPKNQEINYETL